MVGLNDGANGFVEEGKHEEVEQESKSPDSARSVKFEAWSQPAVCRRSVSCGLNRSLTR